MPTALVTGAAGNLGAAVIHEFLDKGYQVAGVVSKQPAAVDNKNYSSHTADLTSETSAAAMVAEVIAATGKIDVAVLTVGGFAMGSIADTGLAAIQQLIRLNFETAYAVARPLLAHMTANNYGRIFLIGSLAGQDINKSSGTVAYGLSKSLLSDLAVILNHEGNHHNVVASLIVPSIIDTPQNRKAMPDSDHSGWIDPAVIARVISFHAGPDADLIRNPILEITG